MRNLLPQTVAALLLAGASAGCSTVSLERERVDRIRSVGIAGFTVEVESSYEEEGESYDPETQSWRTHDKTRISRRDLAKTGDAARVREMLVEQLTKRLGWKVLPAERLAASAEYSDLLRFQIGRVWTPSHWRGIRAYGVADTLMFHQALELTPRNRSAILEQTGVDALVLARITLRIDKTDAFTISSLLGVGAYFPTAVTEFVVVDAGSEDPMWHDRSAESDPEVKGTFQIGGQADDELLMEKALAAARSSFENVTLQYRDGK